MNCRCEHCERHRAAVQAARDERLKRYIDSMTRRFRKGVTS